MMRDKPQDAGREHSESTGEDNIVNETEERADYETDEQQDQGGSPPPSGDEEIARLRDALLRTRAEMDNLVKRNQREMDKARRFQHEGLMRDLLPVIDGLEQGLENADEDDEKSREGLTLTHKLLLNTLENHGLEVIDPMGERFNPEWHEAMSMQPSDEAEPDSIVMVLQKGYRLNDRLLRPARVIVAKEAD